MGKRNFSNIILTGFSYTGKTQVSQILAKRLRWELVDTDDEIEKLAGKPIPVDVAGTASPPLPCTWMHGRGGRSGRSGRTGR